jgi:hypothetical protein
MGLAPTPITEAGRLLAHSRSATLAARRENEEWSVAMMNTATNVNTATNGLWPLAGVVRRRRHDDDPLAAMRGIIFGTLMSILAFWMPLAIALTR